MYLWTHMQACLAVCISMHAKAFLHEGSMCKSATWWWWVCARGCICACAQYIWAAIMHLGLNRHNWLPPPLGLEVISLQSSWKEARRARLMLWRLRAYWGLRLRGQGQGKALFQASTGLFRGRDREIVCCEQQRCLRLWLRPNRYLMIKYNWSSIIIHV